MRRIDPNRLESAPNDPIYLDSNWSWGGEEFGYVTGKDTSTFRDISWYGAERLHFTILSRESRLGVVAHLRTTSYRTVSSTRVGDFFPFDVGEW